MDISFRFAIWFLLAITIPATMIAIPLYLRHRVYSQTMSAVVSSDFRIMDHRMSTVWCSGLKLNMNTTFNAYLLNERPKFENTTRIYWTTKHFSLRAGDREYWGFFLPKGSTISVSSCARFDGASLLVIKGQKHLNKCRLHGDDSEEMDSEESEEANQSSEEDPGESSFSSSEEAQEQFCIDHAVFNQSLISSINCASNGWAAKNVMVYTTPHTDYHYLVISSSNTLTTNDIFTKVVLNKVVYDVSGYLDRCMNVSECSMSLNFSSDEHVVLEVPDRSLWISDIVQSTCEPRTILYFPFYLTVPISILVFAFRGNK